MTSTSAHGMRQEVMRSINWDSGLKSMIHHPF
jgi:hypothetical protein